MIYIDTGDSNLNNLIKGFADTYLNSGTGKKLFNDICSNIYQMGYEIGVKDTEWNHHNAMGE